MYLITKKKMIIMKKFYEHSLGFLAYVANIIETFQNIIKFTKTLKYWYNLLNHEKFCKNSANKSANIVKYLL